MYAAAAIPEPYRILGLRLRPFSLGHYLHLQRFGCAFIDPAAKPNRNDLTFGVLICSMRFAEFLDFVEQKDFLRQIKKWGRRIGWFDFSEKARLFASYLQASLKEPDYIEINPGNDGGDWVQNLQTTLITRCGYSAQTVLDEPLSKCLADYYKLAESEGLVRLLTEEDLAAAEANATALAEWEARKPAQPVHTSGTNLKEEAHGPEATR